MSTENDPSENRKLESQKPTNLTAIELQFQIPSPLTWQQPEMTKLAWTTPNVEKRGMEGCITYIANAIIPKKQLVPKWNATKEIHIAAPHHQSMLFSPALNTGIFDLFASSNKDWSPEVLQKEAKQKLKKHTHNQTSKP